MKVIIADDSLTMRRVLCNMLGDMGDFECLTADGGDVVMQLLDEHADVGLILLDWRMPVMNGIDCLRAVRAREATKTTPVVMITSEIMNDRIMEAVRAGASSYLLKPFSVEKFRAAVTPLITISSV